ncbi:MAG: DUF6391 domain-containing protein [Anaerolineae bacterium]
MSETNLTILQKITQNHALEHATMHILGRRVAGLRLMAMADWAGFTVIGQVDTQVLIDAVAEGLERMREGESGLAMHPNCGTNLAVPIGLSGGLVLSAISLPAKWRFTRLALIMLAGFSLGVRKPLSNSLQKLMTTTTDLDQVHIQSVQKIYDGMIPVHRIWLSS